MKQLRNILTPLVLLCLLAAGMQFIIQMIMQMKFWDARLQSIQKQL